MHGTCPPKGIYKNIHSTIILNSQKSGNQLSVNSNVNNWKYIHTMEDYTERKRMNYSNSQQHGRLSVRAPTWTSTYCMTPNMWSSKQGRLSYSDRGVMGGISYGRGQEESCGKDGNVLYLNLANGYTGAYLRENSSSCTPKICVLPSIEAMP